MTPALAYAIVPLMPCDVLAAAPDLLRAACELAELTLADIGSCQDCAGYASPNCPRCGPRDKALAAFRAIVDPKP